MARLPQPGSDNGTWGAILNDFLLASHDIDGSLKDIAQSNVTGLQADLATKATASDLADVATSLATKADLVTGIVPDAQLPSRLSQASIDASMITSGAIVVDDLVLSRPNGSTVNAGNVRGPQGITGLPGDLMPATAATGGGTITLIAGDLPSTKRYSLTANATVASLPTPAANRSGTISLVFIQATSSGPFTVTFPSLKWAGGAVAPAIPTAAASRLEVHLFWDGVEWVGKLGGTYF